jgi:hypothetical protein
LAQLDNGNWDNVTLNKIQQQHFTRVN